MRRLSVLLAACAAVSVPALADVHLLRSASGSALIFNDSIGSGWRVHGGAPNDGYLVSRKNAVTPFEDAIVDHARAAGVDPMLVKCVMLVESNYNPRALSRKGAQGLMQLMPATARRFGVSNAFDAVENIRGGVRYLSYLLSMFNGNVSYALAAYNAGEGAVGKYSGIPPYAETREYVRRALVAYHGTAAAMDAPMIGGTFRGAPRSAPHVRAARVRVDRGARALTNDGPVRRMTPLLGRVASAEAVASASLRSSGEAPLLGRVAAP